jgi:hypothetical protein
MDKHGQQSSSQMVLHEVEPQNLIFKIVFALCDNFYVKKPFFAQQWAEQFLYCEAGRLHCVGRKDDNKAEEEGEDQEKQELGNGKSQIHDERSNFTNYLSMNQHLQPNKPSKHPSRSWNGEERRGGVG